MRMVSIFLPHLPIERLKRDGRLIPDEQPFALAGSDAHGLKLAAVNAASASLGLLPGLSLADARAICPRLITLPADPEQDAACLLALARWSHRYSPTLNSDGSDGLWLDVTGIPHLFGGEEKLLAEMQSRLARLGFTARIALAETLGGAHALARYGSAARAAIPEDEIRQALAPLPVEALRLAPDVVLLLKRLGLKRIGQLYELPRGSLERRFHSREGAEAVLLRLDQALGRRNEPRPPLCSLPAHAARLPFPEPLITHAGVAAALAQLACTLCEALGRSLAGTRRVALTLYRSDGTLVSIEAGLSAPAREPSHLLRLLTEKIANLDLGFGIDLICLASLATERLPLQQTSFAATDKKARALPLIDRLINHLGRGAVRRLFPVASHLPERAQISRSAFAGAPTWNEASRDAQKPPRPPLLFTRPEPLQVIAEVPEGPPASFIWRRVNRRVIKSEGPERIAPEWWRLLERRERSANSIPPLDGEGVAAKGRDGWGERQSTFPPHPSRHATCAELRSRKFAAESPLPRGEREGRDSAANSNPSSLVGEGGKDAYSAALPGEGTILRSARTRDYYRIEDEDGRRYWVFREGLWGEAGAAPAWYLHGLFG